MHKLRWLLFILLSLPLAAAALRGEWESSGDFPMVYLPQYPFSYSCQIEITDQNRRAFAVGQVELNNENTYASEKEIQWKLVLLDPGLGETESREQIPFKIADTGISLSFNPGDSPGEDQVTLSAFLSLPVGGQVVTPDGVHEAYSRQDKILTVRASIYAKPSSSSRSMFVVCDKKK